MNINTGATINLGRKTDTNRAYRIIKVESYRSFGTRRETRVHLERVADGKRFDAFLKPNAKRIPWNATITAL